MQKEEIKNIVSNGKFFRVKFLKKDNTVREMVCRTGVSKYVKGTGRTVPSNIVTVWETCERTGKEAYRSFDVNRVVELQANGKKFIF